MHYLPCFILAALAAFFFPFTPISLAKYERPSTVDTRKVTSEAGLNIPSLGVAVDAFYDRRLDELVSGYKILHIVVTNRTNRVVALDVGQDQWFILDNLGHKKKAVNHVRHLSRALWQRLPEGLKKELEYPQAVRPGRAAKVDVFFPKSVELEGFRELKWKSKYFKKVFQVMMNVERNVNLKEDIPLAPATPSVQQSLEKYEGDSPRENTKAPEKKPPRFDPELDSFSIPMD